MFICYAILEVFKPKLLNLEFRFFYYIYLTGVKYMNNFIKNIENRNLLLENFSEEELKTIESSVNVLIHLYSSELKRLLKEKNFNSSKLTQEKLNDLNNEIMSYESDIEDLKNISTKLNSILNNFKHLH